MNCCIRLFATFIALSLIIASILNPIAASSNMGREIEIDGLAVDKEGRGVAVKLKIAITRGNGSVIVSEKASADVVVSANFSSWMAARIAHTRHNDFNYIIKIPENIDVSGLSATLLFTLAFTLLLRGDQWDGLSTGTGLVAPNGIIGNVSGLRQKYEVAVRAGYRRVLAPYYPSMREEYYYPVVTIIDAYEKFSGRMLLPRYDARFEELLRDIPANVLKIFDAAWEQHFNKSMILIERINQLGLNRISSLYYSIGLKSLNESIKYRSLKQYYTAASRAFYAYWNILSSYIISEFYEGAFKANKWIDYYLGNLTTIKALIEKALNDSISELTLYRLDVLLNVLERYYDSIILFERAKDVAEKGVTEQNILYFATNMSMALARLDTAGQWLKLLYLNVSSPKIDLNVLRSVLEDEMGLLKSFAKFLEVYGYIDAEDYVNSLLSFMNISSNEITVFSRILWLQRDLSNVILSDPRYALLSDLIYEDLRRDIVRLLEYYHMYYSTILPSGYTALEFYITTENESLATLSTALLNLLVYGKILEYSVNEIQACTKQYNIVISQDYYGLLSLLAIAVIAALVIGYILGRFSGEVISSEKRLFKEIE